MPSRGYNLKDGVSRASRKSFCGIGDSICVGNFNTSKGGWRYEVMMSLRSILGYESRWVGGDYWNNFLLPCIATSGHNSTQCLSAVNTQSPSYTNTDFYMLMIGTNDMLSAVATATTTGNIDSICTRLRTDSPDACIIVAYIIDNSGNTAAVDTLNAAIQTKMAARSDYAASPAFGKTSTYDMKTQLGAYSGTYYSDTTHPNAAGYTRMAAGWISQIDSVI